VRKRTIVLFSFIPLISLIGVGVFASSSITINSGNSVALGAGSQIVATCDNDVNLDPPGLSLDPATGMLMVTTISVSNVSQKSPSGCGNWIMELAASSSSGLQITSWSIPSSAIDTPFYFGGTITGTNMAKTTLTPIDPTKITTIALQMYPARSCADGGVCSLGDLGPDGGPIVYVAPTPFTDPVTGKTYKYIEAAPQNWNAAATTYAGTPTDPRSQMCTYPPGGVSSALSESIGYARYNTNAFLADSHCLGHSGDGGGVNAGSIPTGLLMAAPLTRAYGSDWNIPTYAEANEMCKFARYGAVVAKTKTNCDDVTGNIAPAGFTGVEYATSSKISGAGWQSARNFYSGVGNNTSTYQGSNFAIRPIRYL